jgi:predicted enzyme related to lactoylglutathione lyase
MDTLITDLVERFDRGTLSRRHLLQGLTAIAAAGTTMPAAAQQIPFRASRLDHLSIQTSDLARQIEFYSKVFGLKVLSEDKPNKISRMGVNKVIVSLHEKPPVGLVDHFAIAIDDFNQEQVTAELAKLGLKTESNLDYGFFVRDPEGMPVQIVRT